MIEFNFHHRQGNFQLNLAGSLDAPVTGLFGPSGAGKSTLLNLIAGLTKSDAGYLRLDDQTLFDSKQNIHVPLHHRQIGMVFQDSRLFPHLTVEDNLRYGYRLLASKQRRLSFSQIVELLEITHLLTQKPHQLSGGEKQRVALGRALLTSPRLLLMDEPLASLDNRLKQQILPFLRRVKHELNIPMLYVSHAIDEILYLTSHIAMVEHGQLIAMGPFNKVIHEPRVLALTQSLGLENVLHTYVFEHHVQDGYTATLLGRQVIHIPAVQAAIGTLVSVSVTASNIALSIQPITGVTIQNQLAATIIDIQQVSNRTLITIQIDTTESQLIAEVTAKAVQGLQLKLASKVYCLIKTQSIHPLTALA